MFCGASALRSPCFFVHCPIIVQPRIAATVGWFASRLKIGYTPTPPRCFGSITLAGNSPQNTFSKELRCQNPRNKGLRGAASWLVPTVTVSTMIARGMGWAQGWMSRQSVDFLPEAPFSQRRQEVAHPARQVSVPAGLLSRKDRLWREYRSIVRPMLCSLRSIWL